jgi:hypothetical protein
MMYTRKELVPYQPDHLNTPLLKLLPHLRKRTEFCRAYWREIGGMAEENGPAASEPLVEVDLALGCAGFEVGCF